MNNKLNQTDKTIKKLLSITDSQVDYSDELEQEIMKRISEVSNYKLAIQKNQKMTQNAFIASVVCFLGYIVNIFFQKFGTIVDAESTIMISYSICSVILLYLLYEVSKKTRRISITS